MENVPKHPEPSELPVELLCRIIALMNPHSEALGIWDQAGSMAFKSLLTAAENMTTHTDIHIRPFPEISKDLTSLQRKLSRMPALTTVALKWDGRGWEPPALNGIGTILASLPGLRSLHVSESLPDEHVLPLMLLLPGLQHLDYNASHNLEVKTLQTVSCLTNLRNLTLHQPIQKGVKNLNWCSELTKLQELHLTTHSTELSALSFITSLRKLTLINFAGRSVEPLSGMLHLEMLNLSGSGCLRSVAALSTLKNMVDLNLSGCQRLSCLGDLSGLTRMTSLNVKSCKGLVTPLRLSGMKLLVRLVYSNMGGHAVLQNNFDTLSNLTSLDLSSNHLAFIDLACLAPLTNLRSLSLAFCWGVGNISPLSSLFGLTSLELKGAEDVKEHSLEALMLGLTRLQLS